MSRKYIVAVPLFILLAVLLGIIGYAQSQKQYKEVNVDITALNTSITGVKLPQCGRVLYSLLRVLNNTIKVYENELSNYAEISASLENIERQLTIKIRGIPTHLATSSTQETRIITITEQSTGGLKDIMELLNETIAIRRSYLEILKTHVDNLVDLVKAVLVLAANCSR